MNAWGDLIARTRGLAGQLVTPAQLSFLRSSGSVASLAEQLVALRIVPPPAPGTQLGESGIELFLRRRAGARLGILAFWANERGPLLAPLYDDEDRRTLRALVRGALASAPPESRTAGLIATPALPARAIEQLSRAGDLSTIAATLLVWEHPFGAALAAEARRQQPDLLRLEMALTRAFAERALGEPSKSDHAMAFFVERTIDLENLAAALALAEHKSDQDPSVFFVAGGLIVTLEDLRFAHERRSRAELVGRLAPRVRKTPLAAALDAEVPAAETALAALTAEFATLARVDPLGLAPVIHFALLQRAELRALLGILWSVSLGMPRAAFEHGAGASP